MLDRSLSKTDYNEMRDLVNEGRDILPPYHQVQAEKQFCRPPGVEAFDCDSKVPMQKLLDHTMSRILDDPLVAEKLSELSKSGDMKLKFLFKYGCDGSKGHPIFKQVCECCRNPGSLLASHLVGLQLLAYVNGSIHIVYDNALANSSIACRPLRLWWVSETKTHLDEELKRLKDEINGLEHFAWNDYSVEYSGKLKNVLIRSSFGRF